MQLYSTSHVISTSAIFLRQVQGFEKAWSLHGETRRYNGLIHCLTSVLKEEGVRGLYRGLSPSLLKAVVTTAVSFWGYEQSVKLMSSAYVSAKG